MKAIVCTAYGPPDVMELQDVPQPAPKADQVLIKTHASTVTAGDCEMRRFQIPFFLRLPMRLLLGIRKPRIKIFGQEFSGEIVECGSNVTNFKVGDKIFAPTDMKLGGYGAFICLSAKAPIAIKPDNISFAEAACLPTGGLNALYFLDKANIQKGEHLLLIGAAGSIGTLALQMAKNRGAIVTAIDSTDKLPLLKELGADHVIDYTKEDFSKAETRYDAIIEISGKTAFSPCVKALKPNGRLLIINLALSKILRGWWVGLTSSKKVKTGVAPYKMAAMEQLRSMAESQKIKAIIDRSYPLSKTAEAHQYVETGAKKGCVVIDVLNNT
ncbi:MAG: NAD(P)-dependent alcohol dehydrogenase [Bacteroidetes bacterium]|nr:NAD(P)-dependent alcohol dehydrogenase [Bacteroidota bacterium]